MVRRIAGVDAEFGLAPVEDETNRDGAGLKTSLTSRCLR